jgi:hypothetical protein
MKTEKVLYKVIGMYCITCKPIVEKQLKHERAVKKIEITTRKCYDCCTGGRLIFSLSCFA